MATKEKLSMTWLLTYLKPVRGKLALLLVMLLASTALQLINPQIVARFIDTAAADGLVSSLLVLAGAFLVVAVSNQLITVAVSYIGNDVAWRSTNKLRGDLLRHCLKLDMRFHNVKTPGEMIERVDGDVTGISNFFAMFIVQVIGSFVLLAGILGYMFNVNALIAGVMTLFTLLAILFMVIIRNLGVQSSKKEREASAALFGLIEERIAGIEDVQSNGHVPYVMNRFYRAMRSVAITGRRAWMLRIIPWNTTVVLFALAVTAVLMLGVHYYLTGRISLGMLFLIYQYTQMLNDPIEMLGDQVQEFQKAKSGMLRSRELLSSRSEIISGDQELLPEDALSLEFEAVSFHYSEDKPVLNDLTFRVEAGERLGIIGRTGSGKSSLSRVLLRLYNINQGVIRIGGIDITKLDLPALYQRVGMVTQDVQLFDGTLRDNLTLFNPEVSDEQILETTGRLGLSTWIEALPDGLDTHLSSGGSSLSAGEAQLFALTRVFLTEPSLVVLDEPSSRLDAATESMLQLAVDSLMEHCTGVIIAHRLATLEQVDKILVLGDGQILEFGDRKELASRPDSHYARLLATGREEELA
ncbi:ABC transporter ATP-binding protein/permease [Paenibacillus motobuensis]|uniref:ABC transporter ATP-binding protein n=1 Tax=Paenibacillus TaxID=44249 RepID=UPI00204106A1|nr:MULTISPECIES: ABC transporter ATP-binding protein [Paenibacillus]MCM3038236.1 ABC transporter ATP-binding protein/permease [Paenibacillus lutimineralis]MCM3645340.1 ABC transporter ATP-binding protein/permease [Paenibacillus motobuensis]